MSEKMGGRSPLRILAFDSSDVRATLIGSNVDPRQASGFAGLVQARFEGRFEVAVEFVPPARLESLLGSLEEADAPGSAWRDTNGEPYDLVVLSVSPDGAVDAPASDGDLDDLISRVIERLKQVTDSHVAVLNGSSLDPEDETTSYHGVEQTVTERIRRLNLGLVRASIAHGISILDVDRVVAELGGRDNVLAPLKYAEAVYDSLGEEFVTITEQIGFFEHRPLLPQVGKTGAVG